jgi:hypothetical protein
LKWRKRVEADFISVRGGMMKGVEEGDQEKVALRNNV